MTEHKGIYTFMDCPDRKLWTGIFGSTKYVCTNPYCNIPTEYCGDYDGYCPRGYQR